MGGLGNGRRGGRAPPLMVAALIACILVLGFNYWVSSSRNLELQTKLYELEGQVRRGAAERGVAEMKKNEFQEQIQKQAQHISRIESLHSKELDDVRNTYTQEKAKLEQNISSSTKTIEELKGQLNQLNDDLGKLQKELQSCKANTSTLNNKFTVDMAHCQSQVLSQKTLCDEKVAAVKLEVQKNMQKEVPPPGDPAQKNAEIGAVKEDPTAKAVPSEAGATAVVSQNSNNSQGKGNKAPELLTNDINIDKESPELPPADGLSQVQNVLSTASGTQSKLQQKEGEGKTEKAEATIAKGLTNNLTGDKDIEVMDIHEEGAQTEEADPGMEDMLIGQGKADETAVGQRLEDPDEYDADEQVVGGVDLEKEQRNKNMEEEMADYNGDDENEGEFEADKQAALAQI